jgi:ribonuclease HII
MIKKPSFKQEKELLTKNYQLVFGMDEVGRGSFAGPLVASAVCFKQELSNDWFKEINDSKLLTGIKRDRLSKLISMNARCFMEIIDVETINKIGIGKCNQLIFERLIKSIIINHKSKIFFIIDGRKLKIGNKNLNFIIKGDQKSISIAAASIIAKVYRDNLMKKLSIKHPGYNFAKNKGYGTKFHREAIKKLGLCAIHRKSFNLDKFLPFA